MDAINDTDNQCVLKDMKMRQEKRYPFQSGETSSINNGLQEEDTKPCAQKQRYEEEKQQDKHDDAKTPNKVVLLCTIVWATVIFAMGYALKPPFYPDLANQKGISPSVIGLVISTVDLGIFLISLPAGNSMFVLGTKKLVPFGMTLLGVSTIAFSTISYIENPKLFVSISILSRIVEAVGHFVFYLACTSTLMTLYPESMGVMTSGIELSFGLGLILGPLFGGILIDAMAFTLPFALLGGVMLLTVPLILYVIPQIKPKQTKEDGGATRITTLFKIPKIWIGLATVSASNLMFGFQNATLEHHLEQFDLSETVTGVLFSLAGFMYSTSTVVAGTLCDRGVPPMLFITCGLFCQVLGNAFIGPLAWLPLEPQLTLIIPGLVISGVGIGGTIIPSMMYMRYVLSNNGFSGNVDINGMLTAMLTCAFAIGATLGASLGGVALDKLGYRPAQFIFISYISALLLFILILTLCQKTCITKKMRSGS